MTTEHKRTVMVINYRISYLVQCLIVCLVMIAPCLPERVQAGDVEKRILILPFEIHADKDMSYLEDAVFDMLSSRLERAGRVSIARGNIPTHDFVRISALGKEHRADYIITGSMTFFGEEVSTDARVFETGKEAPVLVFHEYGHTGDGVLTHIEKLAQSIDRQMSGAENSDASVSVKQEKTGDLLPPTGAAFSWHSQKLTYPVVGMSAGDLDGDGQPEWVLAAENEVYIYSIQAEALVIEATLPQDNVSVIGVDAVDVNGNQRAEIFLTRKRRDSRIDSAVIEWNGTAYIELQTGLKWYFRAERDQQNRLELLGQAQGNISSFRTGAYMPGKVLNFPVDVNLYWMGFGDVMGTGGSQTVRLGRKDMLSLIGGDDTVEWSSAEPYGGSNVYLETPAGGNFDETDRHYLSQRIHVTDIDGDGRAEVILPRNKDAGGRLFRKYRNFKSSAVEILAWKGTRLETVWETGVLSGYISDTWLMDVTGDGRPELAYCLVTGTGIMGGGRSRLYIQEIPNF
jgi:TolB-like protein